MVTLSDEERTRFREYLEQEINSDTALLAQMEKMNLPESLIKDRRMYLTATKLVWNRLVTTEAQSITR